jgi:hypothetical protein
MVGLTDGAESANAVLKREVPMPLKQNSSGERTVRWSGRCHERLRESLSWCASRWLVLALREWSRIPRWDGPVCPVRRWISLAGIKDLLVRSLNTILPSVTFGFPWCLPSSLLNPRVRCCCALSKLARLPVLVKCNPRKFVS